MTLERWATVSIILIQLCIVQGQEPVGIHLPADTGGMPPADGYKPPAQSLLQLMESDLVLQKSLMEFLRTGDRTAYRTATVDAARSGNAGAALLLGEQYIPEECLGKPNQDVPDCGQDGKAPAGPRV